MKAGISFIIISILTFLIISCNTNEPVPPLEKPPGYQDDIPWPSLADSPWPMFRADPQNTSRAKLYSIASGAIDFMLVDSIYFSSDLSVFNTKIYFIGSTNSDNKSVYLLTLNESMLLSQQFNLAVNNNECSTPLITSDDKIYFSSPNQLKLYATDLKGNLLWSIDNVDIGLSGINLDKEGNIYFTCLNNGSIKLMGFGSNGSELFQYQMNDFVSGSLNGLSFSNDGKFIYIPGKTQAVYAFDVSNKSVSWSFGNRVFNSPIVVESNGNIICASFGQNNKIAIYKLSPNGQVLWEYPIENLIPEIDICLDKMGNIIISSNKLYSLNHDGTLNWVKEIISGGLTANAQLSVDLKGDIFILANSQTSSFAVSYDKDGNLKWELDLGNKLKPGNKIIPVSEDQLFITGYKDKYLYSIK